MARSGYDTAAPAHVEQLLSDALAMKDVGYVAAGAGQDVVMRLVAGAECGTTSDSNFFEELLVNPTLLKLATQRGNLDCGGLRYIALGYGRFIQFICLTKHGHLSIGVARRTPIEELAVQVGALLKRHNMLPEDDHAA